MDYKTISNLLSCQKRELGMSEAYIGQRACVPQATVHRILSGRNLKAAWSDIAAIGKVLGVSFSALVVPSEDMLEARATEIAQDVTDKVQATNSLEGQGLSDRAQEKMRRQTLHELMAGAKRRLWQA